MNKKWDDYDDDSYEKFRKDRSMKKKEKRGNRYFQKKIMREIINDRDLIDNDFFKDYPNGRTE
jgi:hypothetical protein